MPGLTKSTDIDVTAREIDFVTRFEKNWTALQQILGIMRPIKKTPGTVLRSYETRVKTGLEDSVAEGETIPFTEFEVVETKKEDLTIDKHAKAVTIEAVNKWGAEIAIEKTDEEFLNVLQNKVLTRFYTFLNTGTLVDTASTYQLALAKAKGNVIDKFNKIRRTVTDIVGFVNVLDVYEYIGTANITIQTAFGFQYVKDFMGYSTVFLLSEPDITRGTVIAVPVENIDLYYVDPADSDFKKLGLDYRVSGVTNLIGFHANGNYSKAIGESYAILGMTLWAEYLDGISIVTVDDSF